VSGYSEPLAVAVADMKRLERESERRHYFDSVKAWDRISERERVSYEAGRDSMRREMEALRIQRDALAAALGFNVSPEDARRFMAILRAVKETP
jgi:hypothetical protein